MLGQVCGETATAERKAAIDHRAGTTTITVTKNHGAAPFQLLVWQDFDDFWRELEGAHAQTPYTFDAYDEEVARIAFKAGRESMRQQVVAVVERLLAGRVPAVRAGVGEVGDAQTEVGRAVLRELVDDMSTRTHEN